jgi:hypothetical protein
MIFRRAIPTDRLAMHLEALAVEQIRDIFTPRTNQGTLRRIYIDC